jgi:hypothetical protein
LTIDSHSILEEISLHVLIVVLKDIFTALLSRFDNRHSQYPRRDKPICSHYGFKGHIVDKCYKFHGYPLGFQKKSKSVVVANQVSGPISTSLENFDKSQNLSSMAMQCQQILNILSTQAQHASFPSATHLLIK